MENANVEGTQDIQEQNPEANGNVSQDGGELLHGVSVDVNASNRIDELEAQIRGLQSKIDSSTQKIENEQSLVRKRFEALGVELTPEQETKNLILDLQDELSTLKGAPAQAKQLTQAQPERQEVSLDLVGAFTKLNMSTDSVEDIQFATNFKGTQTELENALLARKAGRTSNQAPASSVVTPGGKPVAVDANSAYQQADSMLTVPDGKRFDRAEFEKYKETAKIAREQEG